MKKNLIGASLEKLSAKEEAPKPVAEAPVVSSPETITAADIAAYKQYFGAKWDRYAKRGNPYGEIKGISDSAGDYRRATFIVYNKQIKALQLFAKEEGLTDKQAFEIALEVGLKALGAKGSEEVELTAEDLAPKFVRNTRKKKAGALSR